MGASALAVKNNKHTELPSWVLNDWWYILIGGGIVVALLSSLLNYGIWAIASIGEILVGFLVTKHLLPESLKRILFVVSPIPAIALTGSFLGYWYI